MSYRDIVVDIDDTAESRARLEVAVALAARFEAHLAALFVDVGALWPAMAIGAPSGELIEALERTRQKRRDDAKAYFDALAPLSTQPLTWREVTGNPADQLALHARCADLLVLGQPHPDHPQPHSAGVPGSVLLDSGVPVLMIPYIGASLPLGKRVLLAWSGTRESARAMHGAMPLLEQAEDVVVLSVNPEHQATGTPGAAAAAAHLERHGVKARTEALKVVTDIPAGQQLLSSCADIDADLIVAGAYGHSRLRELVLGGVTRELTRSMTVPVLFSH